MDFILYVLTALVAYFGLLLGASIAHAVKEEAHAIRHHLFLFQLIAIVLLFTTFFVYFPFYVVLIMLLVTFAFLWAFWKRKDVNVLDYIAFSLLFVISSLQLQAHFYATIIIFFFGFFAGAIYYVIHTIPEGKIKTPKSDKKKTTKKKTAHKASAKKLKSKKGRYNHPGVAIYPHKGRHHSFNDIVHLLFEQYAFFLPLTIIAYLIALGFSLLL